MNLKQNLFALVFLGTGVLTQAQTPVSIVFDGHKKQQTIHSFGASDCWRVQYLGKNWPLEKREKMADLLFSTEADEQGNPKGIGLSMWRFNIGSGSHEAGDRGGVVSPWRRTECFLDSAGRWDWSKQAGQRWFLEAARKRGVPYTLGFSISAPCFMSVNGMARADKKEKEANLKENQYQNYADFMARVSKELNLDYLSPINEPQWEWVGGNQEGMQATNGECGRLIHCLERSLSDLNAPTQVVFGEAGDIRYLYRQGTDKPDRDNQISEIFRADGKHSIAGLKHVAPIVTGHSYWSTWPLDTLAETRRQLKTAIDTQLPAGYGYWQTEYCPMEKNDDNPKGGGYRDLTMEAALYIARIIHFDLAVANAASWQSWTAFTEWDYKDGLIFIDDDVQKTGAHNMNDPMVESCKYDGTFRDSKYLWALGNYSLFVRPGMVRIEQVTEQPRNLVGEGRGLMSTAYLDAVNKKLAVVFVNYGNEPCAVSLKLKNMPRGLKSQNFKMYETSESHDLAYRGVCSDVLTVPARSVVTFINE